MKRPAPRAATLATSLLLAVSLVVASPATAGAQGLFPQAWIDAVTSVLARIAAEQARPAAPAEAPAVDAGSTSTPPPAAEPEATATPSPTTSPSPAPGLAGPAATDRTARDTGDRSACAAGEGVGIAMGGELVQYDDARLDRAMADTAATGSRWVRVGAAWDQVERQRGVFDHRSVDRVVDAARRHGLRTVVVLGFTPRWAADPLRAVGPHPAPMADVGPWTGYVREVAGHLAGRADAWEVWNEANHDPFWGGTVDKARYSAYLRAAYPLLKQAAPDVPVLSGASVPHETGDSEHHAAAWMRYFYETGTNASFDGVAFHPYMWHESFHNGAVDPDGGYLTRPGEEIRRIMVEHGEGHKQIWPTEVGFPTQGFASYSEAAAAEYLVAQVRDLRSRPYIGPVLFYTLDDLPIADREGHYGLRRLDGSTKPGYEALTRYATCR